MAGEADLARVYQRAPTVHERRSLEEGSYIGMLTLKEAVDGVHEDALAGSCHPFVFSEYCGASELLVRSHSVTAKLRTMNPSDRPSSLQYVHAAKAFDGSGFVFIVPYSRATIL